MRRRRSARGQRVEASEVRRRARARRTIAGGLELERGGVLVAERAAREPDELARARGLVRRVELLPQLRRVAQRRPARRGRRRRRAATAPRGCATIAPSIALSYARRARSSSRQASRAASMSPAASTISTYAGSSRARLSGSVVSPIARRIAAAAASTAALREPELSESRLRLPPDRLASRYASSAAANSPCSRSSSPCR